MNRMTFPLAALAARLVLAPVGAVAAPAAAAPPEADVPAALQPAPQEALVATLAATGVQVYECRAATAAGGGAPYRWVFVAPAAKLLDARQRLVGWHGAGPHWRADDGSRIEGTVKAQADAPVAGTIPWLLLATKTHGPSPGRFAGVSSIQRVNTAGGAAPQGGCDAANVGERAHVPYTADYRLFRPVPAEGPALPGTRRSVYLPAQFEQAAHAARAAAPVATF